MNVLVLEELKYLIDEANYPYFEDIYLIAKLIEYDNDIKTLSKDLILIKASIPELKIGDITIPSPKNYFFTLYASTRENYTGNVGRADEDFSR